MKNKIYFFLRIFISISLVCFLVWMMRDNLGQIAATIKNANMVLVAAAFLIYIAAVITMAMRLKKVLAVQGLKLS
ncbi:MAG: hypothetical protein JW946_06385, partial [Candidatus Omnitrophica bacterium]|nr:hypothetical protein [Candidatus Omnitrophota bacterium]